MNKLFVSLRYVLSAMALLPLAAHAVSLEDAVNHAVENSFKLQIADEKVNESVYDLKRVRSEYYPKIDIVAEGGEEYNKPFASTDESVDNTEGDTTHSYNASLVANQLLYDGGRRKNLVRNHKSKIVSNQIRKLATTERTILKAIESYMGVFSTKMLLELAQENAEEVKRLNKIVDTLVSGGNENKMTLKFSSVKLSSAEREVNRAQLEYQNALTTFRTLTGIEIDTDRLAVPDYTNQLLEANLDELYTIALAHNSRIALNSNEYQTLDFEKRSIAANDRPRIDLNVKAQQSENVGGDVGVDQNLSAMLRLNFNVFDGFNNESRENKLASRIRQQELKIEDTSRDIKNKITSIKSRINLLHDKIAILLQEIADLKEYVELNKLKYETGKGNVIELMDANVDLHSKRKEYVRDYFDLVTHLLELQHHTGVLPQNFSEHAAIDFGQ